MIVHYCGYNVWVWAYNRVKGAAINQIRGKGDGMNTFFIQLVTRNVIGSCTCGLLFLFYILAVKLVFAQVIYDV